MRFFKVSLLILAALVSFFIAWQVPAYIRAVDSSIIERQGEGTPSLVDQGLTLVQLEQNGAARMILAVCRNHGLARWRELEEAIQQFEADHPEILRWGGPDPLLETLFSDKEDAATSGAPQAMRVFLPRRGREILIDYLARSRRPGVQQILFNRRLTNTVHFPPVQSASGQPLDAVIMMTALLHQEDHLTDPMRRTIEERSAFANRGGDSEGIELIYLDLLSMSRRLSWGQMVQLMQKTETPEQLNTVVKRLNAEPMQAAVFYSVLLLAENPGRVFEHLTQFGMEGLEDMEFALVQGKGGLAELLRQQKRVHHAEVRNRMVDGPPLNTLFHSFVKLADNSAATALYLKYFLVLIGGFFLTHAGVLMLPRPADLEKPLQIQGFGMARQGVFALCIVLAALIFAEPFLIQSGGVEPAIQMPRWSFPLVSEAIRDEVTQTLQPRMDQITIAMIAGFLILQAILYIICLLRLAEIRRQPISADLKMKLLDNEENMFDSGLYVGLGGTVLSLVILALGVEQVGLMAAYSSTLFGIIFVAIIKICHIRPLRRKLILETEFQG